MSAELLREAAQEMRERAEKAERGHWKLWGMSVMADPKGTSSLDDAIDVATVFTPSWCERAPRTWNAEHIASWHPTVALAVADLLDAIANENDSPEGSRLAFLDFIDAPAMAAASLAHLYLGAER